MQKFTMTKAQFEEAVFAHVPICMEASLEGVFPDTITLSGEPVEEACEHGDKKCNHQPKPSEECDCVNPETCDVCYDKLFPSKPDREWKCVVEGCEGDEAHHKLWNSLRKAHNKGL